MEIKLKEFREEGLKISQKEFAERLGISQNTVSRWEDDPNRLSFDLLQKITSEFNCSLSDLMQGPQEEIALEPWKGKTDEINSFNNLLSELNNSITKVEENIDYEKIIVYNNLKEERNHLTDSLSLISKKPSVAFVGSSDAGKSTLINTILGGSTLPAQWTPTTSSGTKVIHVENRPKHMEGNTTAVFQTPLDQPLIDTNRLKDKEHFDKHLVKKGSANLIREFGTHFGDKSRLKDEVLDVNYTIVTYIDAPILKLCDIWDIPGTGANSMEDISDDYTAKISRQGADAVVYLSVSNQFMTNDMNHAVDSVISAPKLNEIDSRIEPFDNIFIVASQAGIVVNNQSDNDIRSILNNRINDLGKSIPDNEWERLNESSENNQEYTIEQLVNRGFVFERNMPELQEDFKNAFISFLHKVLDMKKMQLKKLVENQFTSFDKKLDAYIEKYKEYISNSQEAQKAYDKFLEKKPLIIQRNEEMVELIKSEASNSKNRSYRQINEMYDSLVTIDNLQRLIKEKDFGKKKEEKQRFATWLMEELKSKTNSIIEKNAKHFSEKIIEKLEEYEEIDLDLNLASYNYTSLFIGSLSSVATLGAFSILFSSLGNLGGYILVAKAVSVLATLGISIPGGVATAMVFVSALGGPFTFAIGISIVVGAVLARLSGVNWEKQYAKSLIKNLDRKYEAKTEEDKEFNNKTFLEILTISSDNYWQKTIDNATFEVVNKEFAEKENELKQNANLNTEEFELTISGLEKLKIV